MIYETELVLTVETSAKRREFTEIFASTGDPDDSHHAVNAGCALRNGPH